MTARARIARAAKAAVAGQVRLSALLADLDADVAAKALDVFEHPGLAAAWLLEDVFGGNTTPVEHARSKRGKKEVMEALGRIEHGVF